MPDLDLADTGRHTDPVDDISGALWAAEIRERSDMLLKSARTMAAHRDAMPPQGYILWAAQFIEKTLDLLVVLNGHG